jgi:hypothetical protein
VLVLGTALDQALKRVGCGSERAAYAQERAECLKRDLLLEPQ